MLFRSEIDTWEKSNKKVGDWPIVISGRQESLQYYLYPVGLLQYNVHNGRLAVEVMEWEAKNKRKLDPADETDAVTIRDMLLNLDPKKMQSLIDDLRKVKQIEPGAISHDGIVINGNRRLAAFAVLHKEDPSGQWLGGNEGQSPIGENRDTSPFSGSRQGHAGNSGDSR